MASITPGDGGTLKSAVMENTALELAMLMQLKELDPSNNPNGENNVSLSLNSDTSTVSISIVLEVTQTLDSTGKVVLAAKPYLVD